MTETTFLSKIISGHLKQAIYYADAEYGFIDIVRLDFQGLDEDISLILSVNEDEDSLLIQEHATKDFDKFKDIVPPSIWTKAIGGEVTWIWMLYNQQGYFDSIQFEFFLHDQSNLLIQLIASASSISTYLVKICDEDA